MTPVRSTTRSTEDAAPPAGRRPWLGLAVLILPTLLVAVDINAVFLAMPKLSVDLGATGTQQLWIADGYGFMVAGFVRHPVGQRGRLLVTPSRSTDDAFRSDVTPAGAGVRVLPAAYVTDHVELAYASTVHGVQRDTVTTAHLVIGDHTGAASAYVGMTRGRGTTLNPVTGC
jgi:hypothetical protein